MKGKGRLIQDGAHRGSNTRSPVWLAELRGREGPGRLESQARSNTFRIVSSLARDRMG